MVLGPTGGIIRGFKPNRIALPVRPTTLDKRKPGFDLSIRYHRKGFTRASVAEACSDEVHGSRR